MSYCFNCGRKAEDTKIEECLECRKMFCEHCLKTHFCIKPIKMIRETEEIVKKEDDERKLEGMEQKIKGIFKIKKGIEEPEEDDITDDEEDEKEEFKLPKLPRIGRETKRMFCSVVLGVFAHTVLKQDFLVCVIIGSTCYMLWNLGYI